MLIIATIIVPLVIIIGVPLMIAEMIYINKKQDKKRKNKNNIK